MLYVVYGADEYGASTEAEYLALKHAGDAQWITRLDTSATLQTVRETMLSAPLFAERYAVVARGLLGSWTGRGEGTSAKSGAGKPTPADLVALARALPESCLALLVEGDLSASNKFLKELTTVSPELAQARNFAVPEGQGLVRWIRRTVDERGGSIDTSGADLLADRFTGELRRLSSEIDKLLAYTAPRFAIIRDDVDLLVPAHDEARAFDLVDAIIAKKAVPVVDLTHKLLAAGEAPELILALLTSRVRDVLLLFAAQAEGISPDKAGAKVGWSPGRASSVQRSQRQFTPAEIITAQSLLAATDIALKTRPSHERPSIILLTVMAITQRRDMPQVEAALAF